MNGLVSGSRLHLRSLIIMLLVKLIDHHQGSARMMIEHLSEGQGSREGKP